MAWQFRRSKTAGPFRLNFSKSGIGWSVGVPGLRIGKDAKGRTYTAASIPGTGLYSRNYSSSGTKRRSGALKQSAPEESEEEKQYRQQLNRS